MGDTSVQDLSSIVARAIQHGATMDGGIKHQVGGVKTAALRAPDGHMIALYEHGDP